MMTAPHEWNPVPHMVTVQCPACRHEATFEFAEVVPIRLRAEIPLFKEHPQLEYQEFVDYEGRKWRGAVFFPGLHGRNVQSLRSLPEGYRCEAWDHANQPPRALSRLTGHLGIGTVDCRHCGIIRKHLLNWPTDAWYQIELKKQILWAWNRDCAKDLKDFIAAQMREPRNHRWYLFLLHVPSVFQQAKVREEVVKQLTRRIRLASTMAAKKQ